MTKEESIQESTLFLKEMEGLHDDIKGSEQMLDVEKAKFANTLRESFGSSMKEHLAEETKKKTEEKESPIRRFFKKIANITKPEQECQTEF